MQHHLFSLWKTRKFPVFQMTHPKMLKRIQRTCMALTMDNAHHLVSSVPPQETVKHWTQARWAESSASTTTRLHKFKPIPSNSGTEYTMVKHGGNNGRKDSKASVSDKTSHGCVKNVGNNLEAKKITF